MQFLQPKVYSVQFSRQFVLAAVWLCLMYAFSPQLQAQSLNATGFSVQIAGHGMRMGEVNQILLDSGYRAFRQPVISLGLSAEAFRDRWMIGGSIDYVAQQPGRLEYLVKLAVLNQYMLSVRTGYILAGSRDKDRPLVIFPALGAGAGRTVLRTSPFGIARYNRYSGYGLMFDASLNLRYLAPIAGDPIYKIPIGITAGYTYALPSGWQTNGFPRNSKTGLNPGGPFLRLSFGIATVQ